MTAERSMTDFIVSVPYGFDPVDFGWLLRGEPAVTVSRDGAHRRVTLSFDEALAPRIKALLPPHVVLEPAIAHVHGRAGLRRRAGD